MEATFEGEGGSPTAEITPDPLSEDFLSWVKLTTARPGTWPSLQGSMLDDHQKLEPDIQLLSSYAENEQRALRLEANKRKKLVQSYDRALRSARDNEELAKKKVTILAP